MKQKQGSQYNCHSIMKLRNNSSFTRVKQVVKRLQKGFFYFFSRKAKSWYNASKGQNAANKLKDGHFSVIAMSNGEAKKFWVALSYLAYPPFIKLLEAAEQEFGLNQPGILVIPCKPSKLQRILLGS